jgi:hypothetical protein
MKRTALALPLLLVCAAATWSLHGRLDGYEAERKRQSEWAAPPNLTALKFGAIGYRHLVADMMWLAAIQYYGDEANRLDGHFKNLIPMLERVVGLDPQFEYMYRFGGVSGLGPKGEHLEAVNRLLEAGEVACPTSWRIPFLRGANCLQFDGSPECMADAFAKASALDGAPDWVTLLASRAMAGAQRTAEAYDMISRAYDETKNPKLRGQLEARLGLLRVRLTLEPLEAAVVRYRARAGDPEACPETLAGLLDETLLRLPRLENVTLRLADGCRPEVPGEVEGLEFYR